MNKDINSHPSHPEELRSGALFNTASLEILVQSHDLLSYGRKQLIYSEGQHPNKLFYLESGKIKIYKTSDGGKELIISLLSPGDFFGYIPIINNSFYTEFAATLEQSTVRTIHRKEFEQLITQHQDIALEVIQLLTNDIMEKEEQLVALAYHSLRKKVAEALLNLKRKFQLKQDNENFSIYISRKDLANLAAIATESLIRTIHSFKEEKLIDIKNGKIILLEETKLNNLVN